MPESSANHHVLIVEDDAITRSRVAAYFEKAGYEVSESEDGEGIQRLLAETDIAVVLLDINLPVKDGLALAKELSEKTDVGIILVSARDDEIDRIVGLEIGADDYVTKPFNPRELLARVKNLIRRIHLGREHSARQRNVSFSGWTLDRSRRSLSSDSDANIPLTRGEFELLCAFLDHPGETLHREWLMEKVTHRSWDPNERTIDVLVRRLRGKNRTEPAGSDDHPHRSRRRLPVRQRSDLSRIRVAHKHGQIGRRRFEARRIDHVADMAAMIGSVIDHVQHDLGAGHRALTTADELELDDVISLLISNSLDVVQIPVVNRALHYAKLTKIRAILRTPSSVAVGNPQ